MSRAARPWIVTPHGPLVQLDVNLWAIESAVPGLPVRRRMSIVCRADGGLVFYNAVPVDDATLARVRALGRPTALVVPHAMHGIDATAFGEKLGVGLYGPRRDGVMLRKRFHLAGFVDELPPDPAVTFESMDGTKTGEPVGIVRSGERASLLFCDAYQDYSDARLTLVMRLLRLGGGPKVTPLFRFLFMTDRRALKAHLERLSAMPGLHRVVPSHGPVREGDAAAVLASVARAL